VHEGDISVAVLRPPALEVDDDHVPNSAEAIRKPIRRWRDQT
jgi:hypothetical protein